MRLPLFLTLVRIILSPVFLILYLYPHQIGISIESLPFVLLTLLVLCETSDFLDGFFARRRNVVTDLGKILDPMADSIFRLTLFFSFTQGVIQLPLILVLVFFFRDSLISMLRTVCALGGVALGARVSGKIKAIVQAIASFLVLLLMIPYTQGCLSLAELQQISFYIVLIAALYTAISGVEYIYVHRGYLKRALKKL